MNIDVENLGVIEKGKIKVQKNAVNIKYGINGSGKSTLSKGIELYVKQEDLSKLRTHGSESTPKFSMSEKISNVIIYNQEYVNDYLFKDDLVNNSFEIMINTEEYKQGRKKIDNMFIDLVANINSANSKVIIEELELLNISVPIQKKVIKKKVEYTISAASKFVKAKKVANLHEHLDEKALRYIDKLTNNKNHEWYKWFQAGKNYIDDNKKCPYCLQILPNDFSYTIESIEESIDATNLKHNIDIKEVIARSEKYLSEDKKLDIYNFITRKDTLSKTELERLYEILEVCNNELLKLKSLSSINVSQIRRKFEEEDLVDFLNKNILNTNLFKGLPEEKVKDIEKINQSINSIISKYNELESITKEFSEKLKILVENKKEYINNFLSISGIPYSIEILEKGDNQFQTVLRPLSSNDEVNKSSLSFGEQNAISLMFFSLEACKGYELIILDDPVSSFDNNKKFAILYYLFTKDDALLKSKTVILFTHDFDIIVDFIYKEEFKRIDKNCCFIKNKNGVLVEDEIKSKNISYTIRLWKKNSENTQLHPLLRIVNLRKYLQYTRPEEQDAKNILSSLEHNDKCPMEYINKEKVNITDGARLDKGTSCIREIIKDFSYDKYLKMIQDIKSLKDIYNTTSSSIAKLQLLRMIVNLTENKIESKVFWSFLTEYYHVENNEMTSLDEKKFDVIPDYIMKISDEITKKIFESI